MAEYASGHSDEWYEIKSLRAERDAALSREKELREALEKQQIRLIGLFDGYVRKTYHESSNPDTDLDLLLADGKIALAASKEVAG